MILQNTIIPVEVYSGTIKALYFGNYFEHEQVILKDSKNNTVLQKIKIPYNSLPRHKIYQYPYLTIEGLFPGVYTLYSDTNEEDDESNSINVVVTGDDKQTVLQTAANLSNTQDVNEIKQAIADISDDSDVLQYFYKLYLLAIENEESTLSYQYAVTMRKYIDIQNCRMKKFGLTGANFELSDSNILELDGAAVKIIQRTLYSSDKPKTYAPAALEYKCRVNENDNTFYLYSEVNEYGMPLNFTLSFRPTTDILTTIKTRELLLAEQKERTLERVVDYPSSFLQFSDEEINYISYIEKLQPTLPLLRAPMVSYDMGRVVIAPKEETQSLLELLTSDNIYLAINELDYCSNESTNRRRIGMQSELFYVYADSLGLGAEPYLYWLENESGDIVSDIKVLDLSSEEPIAIKYDYTEATELDDKLRQLNIYWYRKHFDPYILKYGYDSYDDIMTVANQFETNSDIDSANYAENMLASYCNQEHIFKFADFALAIEKDKFTYGRYELNFFNDPIYFKYKHNMLVLPLGENIIYCIESYYLDGTQNIEYLPAYAQTAREYRFDDGVEYGIMSAIDVKTLRTSGFLFINFTSHDIHPKVQKFMIDDIEVGY